MSNHNSGDEPDLETSNDRGKPFQHPEQSHLTDSTGAPLEPHTLFAGLHKPEEGIKKAEGLVFGLSLDNMPGKMTTAELQAFSMSIAAHVDVLKRVVTELDLRDQDLLNAINNLNRVSQTIQTWQTRHDTRQMLVLKDFQNRLDASEKKTEALEGQISSILTLLGSTPSPPKPGDVESKSTPSGPSAS